MASLDAINALPNEKARELLLRCCGSSAWVDKMMAIRPYESQKTLLERANHIFAQLTKTDWLEAFAAHPRIGDLATLRRRFAATAEWCKNEQAGVADADDKVLRDLAECNRKYESKFGYIFIVCATGKTASEMLSILRLRLKNDPETELKIAAAEQTKITQLRLEQV